ncbi:uncharacterized protein Z520_08061 [Fonsecaea multimorphosa CBS 102226]|uniref:DUF1993 domain-containing protein n=1 Tax=Fonsecaea multimorphosa CBS 102226 TaxID=1442371 RepID=A0A0D2KHZ8_9EURO|nr:uncharacterized protein Z520_08061 [Fonsecaea multimorphosa CBS 102226]KIX96283.1 hypothetical protein Z520_08061 [Fonsecaea multimorphosa CBS 102226]OAL21945.1 hypothetical protein AYO22_07542 [Fonsecaea multimorphosa]
MAPLNLYDTAIIPIVRTLRNLSRVLKKGESYADAKGIPHSELIEARIAPDMHPLPFQVQTCSNAAKFLAVRVAGVENVPWDDNEKTFDELQARITKTLDFLDGVKREDFEGREANHEIAFHGMKLTGLDYANEFALPNFYFHAVTAYNILRMKGVEVGKKDWLGWN